MSGDCRHLDGPHTDLLVSLHELLQAGHGGELQLRLPRLPPLYRALLLTGLGGERQAVAVAPAGRGVGGNRRRQTAHVGLLRVGGQAAAAAGL